MMPARIPNLVIALLIVGAFAFSTAGFSAIPMSDMTHDGLPGCIFMQMDAVCPMGFLEHLALWKQTFIAAIPESGLIALLFLMLALLVHSANEILKRSHPPPRRVRPKRSEITPRDWRPLKEAFSNGILNPKPF